MADLSQIETALVSTITQVVYPSGTGNPSIAGAPCKIYRGWPIPANLDRDLAAGAINISVYPLDNEQKVTRFPREWQAVSIPTPSLTLTTSGTTVTVGGTPSSPLNAAVGVDGSSYLYAVQPHDTTTSIATGLASLIPGASNSGPVVTIPNAYSLSAFVGGFGTVVRETKRQKRGLQVAFWCPDPTARDQVVPPVDAALADVDYLNLPDGTVARLIYERTRVSDRVEREGLYRRDLMYSAEYATTDAEAVAQIRDATRRRRGLPGPIR